jgi:hypothetical protein
MLYKNALCVYPHQQGAPTKKYCPPIGLEYIATRIQEYGVKSLSLILLQNPRSRNRENL